MLTFGNVEKDETRYQNTHDVDMRLTNTILRYKGRAVLCEGTTGSGLDVQLAYLHPDLRGKKERIDANSPDLDISSPPIGYVNFGTEGSSFVSRKPLRRQKQGLEIAALEFVRPGFVKLTSKSNSNTAIGVAIEGEYPSIEKAFSNSGLAFSKDFSLHYDPDTKKFFLGCYGSVAGVFPKDGLEVLLVKSFNKPAIVADLANYGIIV